MDLREAPARPGSGGCRPGDGLIGAAGVDSMGHKMKEMGGYPPGTGLGDGSLGSTGSGACRWAGRRRRRRSHRRSRSFAREVTVETAHPPRMAWSPVDIRYYAP